MVPTSAPTEAGIHPKEIAFKMSEMKAYETACLGQLVRAMRQYVPKGHGTHSTDVLSSLELGACYGTGKRFGTVK